VKDSLFVIKTDSSLIDTLPKIDLNSFASLTDSAFIDSTKFTTIQSTEVKYLFNNHKLSSQSYYPQTIDKQNPDWFTVILITIIIAVTLLKVFYSKIFFQIFKAFVNNNTANQIVRDENLLVQRASILLSVICYLVFALFTYKVTQYYQYDNQYIGKAFAKFLFISIFIAISYSIKMISLKIFGYIYNYEKPAASYIFNLFLVNNVLGIVLLPLLILLTYFNNNYFLILLNFSLALIILFFLYRILKGILIWTSTIRYNLFYLFLYICALEIAPLLIIFKIISL
jgi:hypothetical protein